MYDDVSLLNKEFKKFAEPHIVNHEKKLFSLCRKQSDRCPDCIVNLSKKNLGIHKLNALIFGLNHPIFRKKVQKDKIKTNVEKLVYSLKRNTDIEFDDEARDELKFLVKRSSRMMLLML